VELTSIQQGPHGASHPGPSTDQRLKGAAQEFEAILIASMLREVRASGSGGLFPSGVAHDLYRQFFDEEIAKAMARGGGLGVGRMLERQLRQSLPDGTRDNLLKGLSQPADIIERGRHGVSPIKGERQ
jgi:Rod binding domain-containing protein